MSSIWQFSLYGCVELGLISAILALAIDVVWMNSLLGGNILKPTGGLIVINLVFVVKILEIKDMV